MNKKEQTHLLSIIATHWKNDDEVGLYQEIKKLIITTSKEAYKKGYINKIVSEWEK